jgi:hypothetical protein
MAQAVEWHSPGPTLGASEPTPYEVRLDSQQTVNRWRSELTPNERRRLRDRVQELSQPFYSDSDWERARIDPPSGPRCITTMHLRVCW